jgi:hypothetical protein
VEADNDQWTEFLTIIDLLNPRTNSYELQIRSFFESKATEKKVWDEPPSGAKNVVWASEEAKKMAQEQMKDLKAVGTLPRNGQKEDRGNDSSNVMSVLDSGNTFPPDGHKKKKFWRKISFGNKKESMQLPRKLIYEKGSKMDEFCLGPMDDRESLSKRNSRSNKINLQRALAQSLGMDGNENGIDTTGDIENNHVHAHDIEADEALALVKALSLSESEYKRQAEYYGHHDDECIAVADTQMKDPMHLDVAEPDRKMSPDELRSASVQQANTNNNYHN